MAKKKLRRFEEMRSFPNVLQPTREELLAGFRLRGNWRGAHFGNDNPIVLELGCGKGEYTVGLARRSPDVNFIGVDIKGSRIWRGAGTAREEELPNAAFLRIQIEMLGHCFAPGEADGIWITFPDPQLKKKRAKKRLTAPAFLDRYRRILKPGSIVHLKTDSEALYHYTLETLSTAGLRVNTKTADLYAGEESMALRDARAIQTFYERQFLSRGIPITYIAFQV